jgi:hypothetical protein
MYAMLQRMNMITRNGVHLSSLFIRGIEASGLQL